jgi:hypothetical protein
MREIGSVLAGLAGFLLLEFTLGLIARGLWPAYALAYPTRAYTLPVLLARLGTGAAMTLATGALAAKLGRRGPPTALRFGFALMVLASTWHIHIWAQYPVWYHLIFLAYLIPLAALGGRLNRSPDY